MKFYSSVTHLTNLRDAMLYI